MKSRWKGETRVFPARQLAALILASSVCAFGCMSGAGSYRGDGQARGGGSWLNPALIIEFEEFSLDREYKATYRIDHLPSTRGNELRVGIAPVTQPRTGRRKPPWAGTHRDLGTLRFIVQAEGSTMLDCETPVTGLWWRRYDGDVPFGTRLVEPCPTFLPAATVRLTAPKTVTVLYTPGKDSPAEKVTVRLQAGGSTSAT